ncbi:nucleotidyl transferase AbiEii/AbiGii toxin family protein [Phytoactinopolyspora halotolerans]|uniref:Nucleotidyl transferase AbiEii/AbiGii toxin family protein n=1 Tax=Phytoactinopolyspora halotolerans TaxID=1981512 RepID=A0A6L9SBU0_9ACTN|nr:nucleotidyl transferase AbiEii/AbiGii toxin family protein [Phytoactinopolyspora halotolerans]NEE01480.1 nucleotidyl transferase AbiEii/AbiGii toxin family protein [Phytoactinopolyspora halotolerans]
MNQLEAALRRATEDLARLDVRWALIGGFAVSARTEPRFTRDVDIAVAVDDDSSAERLVRSLLAEGYQLMASIEQEATGRLATVRLAAPLADDADMVVDLLFASSGIEREIAEAAEDIEIVPGLTLPVARTGHLIALKLLARDDTRRPRDAADLIGLAAVAEPEDRELAREAVELISSRGYDRGRDLQQDLEALGTG